MRISIARLTALAVMLVAGRALADELPARFEDALSSARGQTVYFNAWGGNERINAYIAWAGERVKTLFGVDLKHVKLADTAEAVTRVLAEKSAGRDDGGSVDLIWINGENFAAMKQAGILAGPFVHLLPGFGFVDVENKPTTTVDFTIPIDGLEAPWGMAQLVFLHDTARIAKPPRRMRDFPAWAAANPGRFTYPAPPDFTGTTFLKQALYATIGDPSALQRAPVPGEAPILSKPLWDFLDALHPRLWRAGRSFPLSDQQLRQLLDDGEIDLAFSFNPGEASSAIAAGLLPDTVRTYVLDGGTIANTHFLAIPYNANAKAGAIIVADFMLSPEAQAHKQDPRVWGDPTVLALDRLPAAARALFDALPLGPATLTPSELGPTLPEPHPAWMTEIETQWRQRYGS